MTVKNRFARLLAAKLLWRIALAVSIAAIIYLATTSQNFPAAASFSDKFNHLIAFMELTILARLSWPRVRMLTSAGLLLGFGLLIELLQAPLPYRQFSIFDLLADGIGIALGLAVSPWLQALARQSPASHSVD